ncbi:hypothetical protein CGGC5_v011675 [Colletotrichum fructicola Nara gc5]|uniref:Uncharacterized protein n=1 Tax=Colletotrichum fructicola (strain Nara gc5) TaxID=1213859 RepID=A0A7J6IRM9_COLFN|nr:hypothetical protein CGGC5_v011675 [Colletotrichum fructicola Nara gc5]
MPLSCLSGSDLQLAAVRCGPEGGRLGSSRRPAIPSQFRSNADRLLSYSVVFDVSSYSSLVLSGGGTEPAFAPANNYLG